MEMSRKAKIVAVVMGTLGLLHRLARQAVQSSLDASLGRQARRRMAELVPGAAAGADVGAGPAAPSAGRGTPPS